MAGANNDIFQRIEKKYMLTPDKYEAFRKRIEEYMKVDDYGLSTICNIYYDTRDDELIRRSIEKPIYKEKLRVRSYGVPKEDTEVFTEIKKKYAGVVYKRRIKLPMDVTRAYLNEGKDPGLESQIRREIDYFMNYYHPVPKMFIGYDRIAMYGREDPELRLTLDFNIRARDTDLDLTLGDQGRLLLPKDYVLMEIKVGGAYPLWMIHLLNELELYGVSFSKYGTGYKQKLAAYLETRKHLTTPGRNTPIAIPGTQPRGVAI